jgi:hypothetical protein
MAMALKQILASLDFLSNKNLNLLKIFKSETKRFDIHFEIVLRLITPTDTQQILTFRVSRFYCYAAPFRPGPNIIRIVFPELTATAAKM